MNTQLILRNLNALMRQQVFLAGQLGLVIEISNKRADNLARLLALLIDTINSEWNSSADELNEIKRLVNGSIDTKGTMEIHKMLETYTTKAEALLARMGEMIEAMPDGEAAAVTDCEGASESHQVLDPPAKTESKFWLS